MKKTFAIILSVVMLICCIPFAANAATTQLTSDFKFTADCFKSGENYEIPEGVSLEILEGTTIFLSEGSSLKVAKGARLRVSGTLVVLNGAEFKVDGFIYGAENVIVNGTGKALANIRFPALSKSTGLLDDNNKPKIKVYAGSSVTGNAYDDQNGLVQYDEIPVNGTDKMYYDLNQYIYIKAEIIYEEEPGKPDKYDDSLMNVYINSIGIPYTQGTHHTMLTTAGDVSYSKWVNDDMFLNTFNIYLPTGEGYSVYGREGEQSVLGETVKLKYGQNFSFKVEIDPEYDMSAYEVYVYNGYGWTDLDTSTALKDIAPAVPDKYGYYTIEGIQGEHTIYVVGVVKNETLLMVGDILDLVRNIFEMVTSFFGEILAFFGLSVGQDA